MSTEFFFPEQGSPKARFIYTNHRGETSTRTVVPGAIRHGTCEFHEGDQWLMDAWDCDKGAVRTFAMRDIVKWL